MVSPQKIKYNGLDINVELNPLTVILDVAFDSDDGAMSSYLNRSALAAESHDGRYKNTHRYKYDELFSPQFTIVKQDFSDFTQSEVRQVLKYLTQTDKPALLEVYYDKQSSTADFCAIGGWTSIEAYKIANNRTVGIVATFEAITPYAMSDIRQSAKGVATEKDTTMYYWKSTLVDGSTVPTYLLTAVATPAVGTEVYSVQAAITDTVFTYEPTFYGKISKVNADSYEVGTSKFKLTLQGTKTKRIFENKLKITIETDDNNPVYPRITINHGYGSTPTSHLVVNVPSATMFNSITDMDDYVENTIYYNPTTKIYYYKAYTPTFTTSTTLPDYVNWTTTKVTRPYTTTDTFETNTFYYYEYEGMYYWKKDGVFYDEPSLPIYGDWKTKTASKAYAATDTFEDKTIYSYSGTYYWLAPYNFYKSTTKPNLQITSVKITNTYKVGQATKSETMIVKNNTGTEQVVVDGANKIISSTSTRRIFGDDFNWQWLPLYDGDNEITITGNCDTKFEYREIRKLGEW